MQEIVVARQPSVIFGRCSLDVKQNSDAERLDPLNLPCDMLRDFDEQDRLDPRGFADVSRTQMLVKQNGGNLDFKLSDLIEIYQA